VSRQDVPEAEGLSAVRVERDGADEVSKLDYSGATWGRVSRLSPEGTTVRNPAFIALLDEIRAIHDSKSHDYANTDPLSNLRMCETFGVPAFKGVLVRLSDKWSRITQLAGGKTPKHESLRDTLIDNAVYSLLAVVLLDERGTATFAPVFVDSSHKSTTYGQGEPIPATPVPVGQPGFVIPESERLQR
jgi:hypothetical protein